MASLVPFALFPRRERKASAALDSKVSSASPEQPKKKLHREYAEESKVGGQPEASQALQASQASQASPAVRIDATTAGKYSAGDDTQYSVSLNGKSIRFKFSLYLRNLI